MMEIKDYSRTPFSSERFDGLPMDVAIKVRDTLAGIIGGAHNTENVFERHFFKNAFEYLDAPPQVVLFYVDPVSKSERPPQRSKNKQDVLQKNLRKHLRWLTRNVVIVGLNNYANMIAGLTVRQKI
ncbi:MAG TPA: hypothetical protein PLB62_13010 [Candidatus Sumerlaeota bacterium]|nr:hypothetical protein [Candidatus Sumerlaeota bacterium]